MNFLEVEQVSKKQNDLLVVDEISFLQKPLQKIAVAGETGSGKSTLLKMIAGLAQPNNGNVFFEDVRVLGPYEKLLPGHDKIGYLSQHFELRNNYRVEELLSYANQWTDEKAAAIYEICRISHLLKRRTDQLSGGEKQRIATAKLLIASPKLLLLDEPFSNLDIIHRNILKEVIRDIGEKLNITQILISHDPADMLEWADEIIVLRKGKIVQKGSPVEIYSQPVNEYVAGLFGKFISITPSLIQQFSLLQVPLNAANILRPEQFRIVTDDSKVVAGEIKNVAYFGSYCDLDISLSNEIITVRTMVNHLRKNDLVMVDVCL